MSIFEDRVYSLGREEKRRLLTAELDELTRHHAENCAPYSKVLKARGLSEAKAGTLEDVPFIPVRLFKTHDLSSIESNDVVKTLTSSGTTGHAVSRIFLDKETAAVQTKTLVRIMQDFLGKSRLPMIVVDHPGVIKNRDAFSARGAGIRGMSTFGRKIFYALRDEDMSLDVEGVLNFLEENPDQPILFFGFTFMVWEYLVQELVRLDRRISVPQGILVHSGGWKKLIDRQVDNATFKTVVQERTGIGKIHDFYGMVEQVGSVFVECEEGRLHAPAHSDVIIRSPTTWEALPHGEPGIIQVVSRLPRSYPGHSLLTEDQGVIDGEDDCTCGRLGKHFRVFGRIAQAEARGCSDTHGGSRA
jgi:phenylacetate-coenzyme A ligase PaaK-like adenylate-forming protein